MARSRPVVLQEFLDATHQAMLSAASAADPARPLIERIFAALKRVGGNEPGDAPKRLPVARHFVAAAERASQHAPEVAEIVDALAALEPHLAWARRPDAADHGESFLRGHANARIVGAGGLEASKEVTIGISLLAPNTTYPDHHHPPEEVYIALSPGEWRQGAGPWHAPGIGGLVHNPPDILHAMRSAEAPLLAVWCLWMAT